MNMPLKNCCNVRNVCNVLATQIVFSYMLLDTSTPRRCLKLTKANRKEQQRKRYAVHREFIAFDMEKNVYVKKGCALQTLRTLQQKMSPHYARITKQQPIETSTMEKYHFSCSSSLTVRTLRSSNNCIACFLVISKSFTLSQGAILFYIAPCSRLCP